MSDVTGEWKWLQARVLLLMDALTKLYNQGLVNGRWPDKTALYAKELQRHLNSLHGPRS